MSGIFMCQRLVTQIFTTLSNMICTLPGLYFENGILFAALKITINLEQTHWNCTDGWEQEIHL